MSKIQKAYEEFLTTNANIYMPSGNYYSCALTFIAAEFNVPADDLADYIARQWAVYPYDE